MYFRTMPFIWLKCHFHMFTPPFIEKTPLQLYQKNCASQALNLIFYLYYNPQEKPPLSTPFQLSFPQFIFLLCYPQSYPQKIRMITKKPLFFKVFDNVDNCG